MTVAVDNEGNRQIHPPIYRLLRFLRTRFFMCYYFRFSQTHVQMLLTRLYIALFMKKISSNHRQLTQPSLKNHKG